MERIFVKQAYFDKLLKSFDLSEIELDEPPTDGDVYRPSYTDHQRLCVELDNVAEARSWKTRDELGYPECLNVYINFDCFRSRVIYAEVVPELRDAAERAILEILAKPENQKYCVVVNFQSQPSAEFVEVDQIAHGKIYTLKREADAPDSPPSSAPRRA